MDDLGKLLTRLALMGARWDESRLATEPALGATPAGLGEVAAVGVEGRFERVTWKVRLVSIA